MRQSKTIRRCALLAVLAGSLTAACQVHAANDFEALLADVTFGQQPTVNQPVGIEPTALTNASANVAQTATDALPEPVAPVETMPAAPIAAAPMVDSCAGGCSTGHCGTGHCGLGEEAFCQPYMPPQIPTSTFYQYWRSNACNVHVWDGYRNRCHKCVDLTLKPKSHHGCNNGCATGCTSAPCETTACAPAPAVSCGPLPSEWCDQPASCDSCD